MIRKPLMYKNHYIIIVKLMGMKNEDSSYNSSPVLSRHDGMHFLFVEDHQAGEKKKCKMKARARRRREIKRRSMGSSRGMGCQLSLLSRDIWKHLRLHQQRVAQTQQLHHSQFYTIPHPHYTSTHIPN